MLKVSGSLDRVREALSQIRQRLSIRGDIVSETGRRRTIELFGELLTPQQVVERICADVRNRGIDAVLHYTERLDGRRFAPQTLRVSADELDAAHAAADPELLQTVRYVRANIEQFQRAVLPTEACVRREQGGGLVELRQRCLPLKRVGVCVPGGAAAYPSTLLMTVVPAQVAGVREIAVVVPPTDFGAFNRDVLAVCRELGVTEIYRMGGAQAVAALAYGVEGVPRVDKIVGPGNLFVALAKKHVYGDVDIDSIAGPSEVIVIADASARPHFVAADLISQAEHSPGSSILITWHAPLIDAVEQALQEQLQRLERGELARESLEQFGALVAVDSLQDAAALTDWMAPEHLHVSTSDPRRVLEHIHNAGAIFLGHYTPVALGDYVAGPSHVLPTGGTARFASGLSAVDFLKRSSVIAYDAAALAHDAEHVRRLADKEGLTAHRASVDIRLDDTA